ncbi:TetR/AcrR family transcriptional regulator [Janibacter massiliensis]|uniref:TetR/AcrR family transcriptional regulator n=1 Tax=Janibacter massiliensis TaxID=2058291 RepID=UPI000D0F1218|nr:TetR/AcrR family transcriptional regulator [Janibacter massiliensis]
MTDDGTPLRADAERRRVAILEAAAVVFAEGGFDVPMERIAKAAGVGVATLYRRFPDRAALVAGVVAYDLEGKVGAARRASVEQPTAWDALGHFVRAAPTFGVSIAPPQQGMPELAAAIREDPQVRTARATLITLLESLVEAAQAEGMLRSDVATGDVVQLLALLKRRPVVPEELAERVGARTRALLLDALRADGRDALPGEPVRVEEFLDRT